MGLKLERVKSAKGRNHMANPFARHLRKNMTDAEQFVWQRIRYRQLGGFRFRRQAPIGRYIADFVCFESKLILELDGGQHASQVEADTVRTQWLESQGFRVFRIWNCEAMRDWDTVAEAIWRLLTAVPINGVGKGVLDSPHPPLRGDLPHKGGG
jgi:very-short-patch-repair endonuclease